MQGRRLYVALLVLGSAHSVLAALGTPDNGRHPFAAALSVRKLGVEPGGRYRCHDWRRGASLIDSASLEAAGYPNLAGLQGRVVVTAAHCIQYDKASGWAMTDPVSGQIATDTEMIVAFEDNPSWYYDAPAGERDETNCDNVGQDKAFYKARPKTP